MIAQDVDFLRCVDCQSDLELGRHGLSESVILNAVLNCKHCSRKFPVINEVGIFFKKGTFKAHISDYE